MTVSVHRIEEFVSEVLPESEVEMRGMLEVEEEVVRPVAVPYPPNLILGDLELAFGMSAVSRSVSSVSWSSRSWSLSRVEPDLDVEGMGGYSIGLAAAVTVVP